MSTSYQPPDHQPSDGASDTVSDGLSERVLPGDRGVTHPMNVGYLVVGLVLLGIAGIWALRAADLVDTHQTRWLIPLVLVVAGVAGLLAFTAKGLSRRRRDRPVDDR
jgi:hypothetical protein